MEAAGIEVAVTQVGDRYVIDEMLRREWKLGGEQSGHIIATDIVSTGDGIAAALLTMRELGDSALAEAPAMEKLPQRLVNVEGRRPREPRRRERRLGGGGGGERRARGPRPRAAAPLRHRAVGPGDGRGARAPRRPTRSATGFVELVRRGTRLGLDPDGSSSGLAEPRHSLTSFPFLCAASSDTWADAPARSSSCRGSKSSNTGAMTRRASACSRTAARSSRSTRSATSPTCAPRSSAPPTATAPSPRPRPASPTPAGPPTAGSPRRTPTRTTTAPARSTSSSTGSSRTTPSCASG